MNKVPEILDFIKTLNPEAAKGVDPGQNLLESGLLDSVAMMELVVWCEEHFGITIDTDDLTPENFSTLEAISAYVERTSNAA